MRLHRFYINKPLGEELVVDGKEEDRELVHQLVKVFRYSLGDKVIFFSSLHAGTDYTYEITDIKDRVLTCTKQAATPNIIQTRKIALALALVKKDTFETVVRQATELGVSHIIPILSARSEKKGLNFERLVSISTEAAEQSGRGDIPSILPITDQMTYLQETSSVVHFVGSLAGKDSYTPTDDCVVWIGPEGGWTAEEEEVFKKAGCCMIGLTATTLKADTAAIAMLSHIALS